MLSLPIRVILAGSGPPTEELLKALTLNQVERESFEGHNFKVVGLQPDYGRANGRWKSSLKDPTEPEREFVRLASALGYPAKRIFAEQYTDERMLTHKRQTRATVLLASIFGLKIGKPVLDAFDRHVYIIHPIRPLPPECTHIPVDQRGASVIRNIVTEGKDFVPMQVVLIRAEEVKNPTDPAEWDAGEVLIRSRPFLGPEFPNKSKGPGKRKVDRRIVKTVKHMAKYFGDVLMGLPRELGITPQQMLDFGMSTERVRQLGRFTPEELIAAGLVNLPS